MTALFGWQPKRLIDLAEYINGYAFKPEDWRDDGLPIVRIEQLRNPAGRFDFCDEPIPSSNIIDDGDLIFSWSATLLLRIWRHGRAALNQHLFKVIERQGVDRHFLKAFIEFNLPALTAASHGSTMQHITRKELARISASVPESQTEQAKIGEVVSAVDRAIELSEALIATHQRIKTGLMQDLLTRGIDEHGNLRSEQTHGFKESPIGRVPREWNVRSLGEALKNAGGFLQTGPFGSQLHAHEYVHEGVPVVMPQDILSGQVSTAQIARISEARANDLRRHRLQPNDIVFSRRGDLSRAAAIGERETGWLCGTGCFLLRVPANRIESRWLADVYRHHDVQRQVDTNAVGSTMPSLNNGVMAQLTIPFPSVEEQREIARRRDAMDRALEAMVRDRRKLVSLKTGLMQDLLTGRKRVTPLLETADQVLQQVV